MAPPRTRWAVPRWPPPYSPLDAELHPPSPTFTTHIQMCPSGPRSPMVLLPLEPPLRRALRRRGPRFLPSHMSTVFFLHSHPYFISSTRSLCSEMVVLSNDKVLVYSDAASEVWSNKLDQIQSQDALAAATRLKWKPSKNGGCPVASPSATTTALSATRKQVGIGPSSMDHITEVILKGEVGREDAEVMSRIMAHAATSTGLTLKETAATTMPRIGESYHLASRDAAAPPGRLRLLIKRR